MQITIFSKKYGFRKRSWLSFLPISVFMAKTGTNEWFRSFGGDDHKVQDIIVDSKAGRILSGVSFWMHHRREDCWLY